jgi:negative regulator of sigma E activity
MTDPLNEQLSAFIDGELPRTEGELFVRQVPRDAELRAAASRYYLIGEAIRADRSPVRQGFGARVCHAVSKTVPDAGIASSVTTMARELPRSRFAGWWKPVAGVAVAAGVALAAIFIFQDQQGSRDLPQVVKVETSAADRAGGNSPVSASAPAIPGSSREKEMYVVPDNASGAESPLTRAQLASYIFAHSEYSSLQGRRNVVSDADAEDEAANRAPVEARAP